jgi:Predicted glutamine amidotransferase involved in pyridoxine biosynthesis
VIEPPGARASGTSASSGAAPAIGVLALQGDVREHLRALEECGARARPVRRPDEP